MNNPPPPNPQQQQQNNGTELTIHLCRLLLGMEEYSSQNLQQAMDTNTTVTVLTVDCSDLNAFHRRFEQNDYDGFLQFLLRYITNRDHLRKFRLDLVPVLLPPAVIWQFLLAAAESKTLHHLCLSGVSLPIQAFVDFGRANHSVQVLELEEVTFRGKPDSNPLAILHGDTTSEPPYITPVDKLILVGRLGRPATLSVNPSAESVFQYLVSQGLKFSSLDVKFHCDVESFRNALGPSMDSVENLSVGLEHTHFEGKSELLEEWMPLMPHLKSFRVNCQVPLLREKELKEQLLRMVVACSSIEEVEVEGLYPEVARIQDDPVMQLMQVEVPERNRQLRRFVANPEDFPERDLLILMLQLENCLTGLFQLARKLPKAIFRGNNNNNGNRA